VKKGDRSISRSWSISRSLDGGTQREKTGETKRVHQNRSNCSLHYEHEFPISTALTITPIPNPNPYPTFLPSAPLCGEKKGTGQFLVAGRCSVRKTASRNGTSRWANLKSIPLRTSAHLCARLRLGGQVNFARHRSISRRERF